MRRGFRIALLGLVLGVLGSVPAGCGFGGAAQVTLGYLGWDENVANSTLIMVLLEEELGYENVELKLAKDVGAAFENVAEEEADVFMDAWFPNHRSFVEEHPGRLDVYREPWYDGETEFGIAVPHYMEGIDSIADLRSIESGMITGIEPGAVLMEKISNNTVPEYGLDFSVVQAPTPAMLIELREAYSVEEPFVFVAWSPHWMNQEYDFRYLEDPKDSLGTADDPQTLHTVARKGFAEDDPVAQTLISAMRLNETQVGSMEIFINQAAEEDLEPEVGVRRWLRESENRTLVEPWVEAARRVQTE